MKLKLNTRLQTTADRQDAFQLALESEILASRGLLGSYGIVSQDGEDVDNALAACALTQNISSPTAFDVLPGRVVFLSGETVLVGASDIIGVPIDTASVDPLIVRLQYGEVEDGPIETNPYLSFPAYPKISVKTSRAMLVVETFPAYSAQTQAIKDLSVVLGAIQFTTDGQLSFDLGRDTYSFSRPWFSPVDATHRSMIGSGTKTTTNPHATAIGDLSAGSYTMWQAMNGAPAVILARPTSVGRIPGTLCSETVPSGSFVSDSTGRVTGKAGALYAALGFWPERLLRAKLPASTTDTVAAWIPKGRNLIAVYDPIQFPAAADLEVYYTKVTAGSLPGSTIGLTTVEMSDPATNELLVAGGNFFTALSEKKAIFTDVGLVPMSFDILVDGDGKVYKRPDCLYCNTKLDTIGSSPVTFTLQPRQPSRLRIAVSNYNPGTTELRFQITGTDELGAAITEQVVFTGPLPAPGTSAIEVASQRKFTSGIFATVQQFQVLVRSGDGPNTTVTAFSENMPDRPETQDDLLLATVHWDGSNVSANYAADSHAVLDRRLVSAGGGDRGLSAPASFLNDAMFIEAAGAIPTEDPWVTIVEDFHDPQWVEYPAFLPLTDYPLDLPGSSLSLRYGYQSRRIPFANQLALSSFFMRMIPVSHKAFPNFVDDEYQVRMTLYSTAGNTSLTGRLSQSPAVLPNPYPPYPVIFDAAIPPASYYAVKVRIQSHSPENKAIIADLLQGFVIHARN